MGLIKKVFKSQKKKFVARRTATTDLKKILKSNQGTRSTRFAIEQELNRRKANKKAKKRTTRRRSPRRTRRRRKATSSLGTSRKRRKTRTKKANNPFFDTSDFDGGFDDIF